MQELLAQIARALDGADIPYMVIGGQAVLVHGEARFTNDIDITLGIGAEEFSQIVDIAEHSAWEILVENAAEFVEQTMVLPCRDRHSGTRIEFIFSFTPYEQQAIARAVLVHVAGVAVRFASVEDLIVHKIFAGRPRDIEDVRTVMLKQPQADRVYIRDWLRQFDQSVEEDLAAEFESVLREIDD